MDLPPIFPGDCLLYSPSGISGLIIALKTWHKIAHVEIVAEKGFSYASRDGIGVGKYPLRLAQLKYILRPETYNSTLADEYFQSVNGQKYDFKGLLCFALAVKQGSPDRQFCSEFATNLYRAGGCSVFPVGNSADTIAPFEFLLSSALDLIKEF